MGKTREKRTGIGWVVAALVLLAGAAVVGVQMPDERQRLSAIGPVEGLSPLLKKALDPAGAFEPLPAPGPQDWLAAHPEPGQTFAQFVQAKPNRPDQKRKVIYLQPLSEFRRGEAPPVDLLQEYAAAYFTLEVRVLPPLGLAGQEITTRRNPTTGNRQLLTGDILAALKKRIPDDAFCLLGITMEDLYPAPSWNFVFGEASLRERVGVYSFARYDPAFYGAARGPDHDKTLLRRSCKVLVHETGHMFGLLHCVYFRCVFNGSNHLDESDARPQHECPVDLHKLQYSIGFDVARRYAALLRFYRRVGFDDEAAWTKARLERLVGRNEAGKLIRDTG
jgi:archaemetzincin